MIDDKAKIKELNQEIERLNQELAELRFKHDNALGENNPHKQSNSERPGNSVNEEINIYRLIVELANSIIIRFDANGVIKYVNEYTLQFFGYTHKEMIGKNVRMIVPEKEISGRVLKNLVDDVVRNPQNFVRFENENLRKNGDHVWVSWTNRAITGNNGEVLEIVTIGNDISERKKTEEILEESQAKLKTIFDLLPIGVAILDREFNLTENNHELCRIIGLSQEDIRAGKYKNRKYIHRDNSPVKKSELASSRATKENQAVVNVETGIVKEDGSIVWTVVSAAPLPDGNTVVVTTDITDYMKAKEALTESQMKLQTIFDLLPVGVCIFDKDNNLLESNMAARRVLDLSQDYIKKYEYLKQQFINGDGSRKMLSELATVRAFREKKPVHNVETGIVKKEGSLVWTIVSSAPLPDDNVVTVLTDITDLKQTENLLIKQRNEYLELSNKYFAINEELIKAKEIASEKDREIMEAIVSTQEEYQTRYAQELHDGLGPVLSTLKMYIEWFVQEEDQQNRAKIIKQITQGIDDAIVILKNIANQLSPHILQNFGLVVAIQNFAEKIKCTSGLEIMISSNTQKRFPENIEINLYRVLVECINNSLKHAEPKKILITFERKANFCSILYIDDGKGFNVKEEIKKRQGMGLFNIINRIKTLGGNLDITSDINAGTRIKIDVAIK